MSVHYKTDKYTLTFHFEDPWNWPDFFRAMGSADVPPFVILDMQQTTGLPSDLMAHVASFSRLHLPDNLTTVILGADYQTQKLLKSMYDLYSHTRQQSMHVLAVSTDAEAQSLIQQRLARR